MTMELASQSRVPFPDEGAVSHYGYLLEIADRPVNILCNFKHNKALLCMQNKTWAQVDYVLGLFQFAIVEQFSKHFFMQKPSYENIGH